ncbi:hypothetical protein PsorP6_014488 [Peronosclerospora sorghi]|uniref:Uncharacterized protein n=1 Tax=Peronosclerospora sorghi TaxID=230839 RepID=A0ACC0VSQ0_9STRA|nr:hypothetical protein PsorP6_014488 [Peronosclerospora sorghi]
MIAPHLLHKCEEFLLHPTVRALPLANRVDFLEKKGLSPEEITHCLTRLERCNGLSQLVRHTAHYLTENDDARSRSTSKWVAHSPRQLLQFVIKEYGVMTMLLMLLGYGYVQFRRQKTERMLLRYEAEKTQRKKRKNMRVEALLAVLKDQQTQYDQAAKLLRARFASCMAAKEEAAKRTDALKFSASKERQTREVELQALQSELLELKRAVLDKYMHPSVDEKVMEINTLPKALNSKRSVTDRRNVQVVQTTSQCLESSKPTDVPCAEVMQTHRTAATLGKTDTRDQRSMSLEEIVAMFLRGHVEDELSTATSYRLLLASS